MYNKGRQKRERIEFYEGLEFYEGVIIRKIRHKPNSLNCKILCPFRRLASLYCNKIRHFSDRKSPMRIFDYLLKAKEFFNSREGANRETTISSKVCKVFISKDCSSSHNIIRKN